MEGRLGQGNPASALNPGQGSENVQPFLGSEKGVEPRRIGNRQQGPRVKMPASQVTSMAIQPDQANRPSLTEALQRMMASGRETNETQFVAESADAENVPTSTNVPPSRNATTPAAFMMTQTASMAQPSAVAQVAASNAETLLDPLSINLMSDPMSAETAGLSQLLTEAVMSPGTAHRPETPRLVAVQLAEALATKGERNIDVALSPEELGRVKMRVSTTDSSVIVMITTERPETGDLMRRHINELAEEFRQMGFENISFEFGGEGMSGQTAEGEGNSGSSTGGNAGVNEDGTLAENTPEAVQQNLRLGESGLDMRM